MNCVKLLVLGVMAVALTATGCGDKGGTPTGGGDKSGDKKGGTKGDDHAHGKGPNGGVVFDFGKYHAELDIKHDKKEMRILILGSDEKTPVAVAAKDVTVTTKDTKGKNGEVVKAMTVKLTAVDGKDGKATRYVGTDPGLGVEAEHSGAITGVIDGKPASGEFKE